MMPLAKTGRHFLHSLPTLQSTTRPSGGKILLLLHSIQLLHSGSAFSSASPFGPVRSLSSSFSRSSSTGPAFLSTKMGLSKEDILNQEDPYLFLEEVESDESIAFAKLANEKCLNHLGDPSETDTYGRVLSVLESNDRIPHVSVMGYEEESGDMILFNFWKDSENPKGLWRKTTLTSYQSPNIEWTTVLDLDKLAKDEDISWVWKGYVPLPRSLDPKSGYVPGSSKPQGRVTRALLQLSRGGADAIYLREFDLLTQSFVDSVDGEELGFALPEGKTRATYKTRDVLLVGANVGENAMTTSGYPRTVREWTRGTKVEDAPVVFEGEDKDVSIGSYLMDETHRGGAKYEVRYRSITFYESTYFVKKEPSDEFIKLAIAPNTEVSVFGKWMILLVKADWEPKDNGSNRMFKSGTLVYVDAQNFLNFSKAKEEGSDEAIKEAASDLDYHVLFEPTATTSYSGYSATKNYLILDILDDVKQQLKFYKLGEGGGPFVSVGGDNEGKLRASSVRGVDSKESDFFWLTCSSYTQPSTLYLADADKCKQSTESSEEAKEDDYIVTQLKSLPHMYDSSDLEVSQHFATSDDGTKIPFFMVSKKGIVLDGSNPTLLYGYGGFEISLTPRYISTVGISWLERGGVYVEANIRGGGEYGPDWHQSALKKNRNKCYEDFIAVGKHLISSNICTPKTLACRGGSNGGLLTGNMLVQAPDLFGAIHIAVPLLDMKRYHKLLAGASWMAEYGDPDTDDWEDFLYKFSPYHNIDLTREKYPHVLLTTSTRDDRVHPAHARKMVKKLWDLGEGKDWPVFYYENIEGGHGGAADSKQEAFMTSLSYDFMWRALTSTLPKT